MRIFKNFMALMVSVSVLFPASCFGLFAITIDYEINENTVVSSDVVNDIEIVKYVEDEIIIMLSETVETQAIELYSVYSNDESTEKNTEITANGTYKLNSDTVIASTRVIDQQLDLGIGFSEMRLLNPSDDSVFDRSFFAGENENNIFSLKLQDTTVEEALNILNDNPAIEIAEPNYIYSYSKLPDDDEYYNQYALNKICASNAWETTTGSSEVVVGIIDSGIDGTHPDLIDNLWENPYYAPGVGCSKCSYSYDYHGYNFTGYGSNENLNGGGVPTDMDGHGTHVAGIVGARGDNGKGVTGVNWNVSLAWLGCDSGEGISTKAVVEALSYANNHGIYITNNSYGSTQYSSILEQAIMNYDGLFVAAAGNEGENNDNIPHYPASYDCPNIISVASTDYTDQLSDFSNNGVDSVDVAAPGSDIISTIPGGQYTVFSGTSMASPHVAGVAALVKAENPSFNALQIKAAICGTVQKIEALNDKVCYQGIVDASAAIKVSSDSLKKVTFDYGYSGAPNTAIDYVLSGGTVREPSLQPIREGYVFVGWYTTPQGNIEFSFNDIITTNTTIYGKWNPVVVGSFGEKFPDYKFRKEVLNMLRYRDGVLRSADTIIDAKDISIMSSLYNLDISSKSIRDISGIEYFTGLRSLNCSNNRIGVLDLNNQSNLVNLNCSNNILTNLSGVNCPNLEELNCGYNALVTLDFDNLLKLKQLDCAGNQIRLLDVAALTQLEKLRCSNNKIYYIDLNLLANLSNVDCSYNRLTSLIVNDMNNLERIDCSNNDLTELDLYGLENLSSLDCSNNDLTELDLYGLESLSNLDCSNNKLSAIEVYSMNLDYLDCSNNELNSINNIDNNPNGLYALNCSNNNLTELRLVKPETLQSLNCSYNRLTDICVGNNLINLNCSNNMLTGVDFKNATLLNSLDCSNNMLTGLDVKDIGGLQELDCSNNYIEELKLNEYCGLLWLDASNNNMIQLTISEATELLLLNCSNNKISSLNIGNLQNIKYFDCSYNKLSIIDVSEFENLVDLNCSNNELNALDLGDSLEKLQRLDCSHNKLTTLDVRDLSGLVYLFCTNNNLKELYTGIQLRALYANYNAIEEINLKNSIFLEKLFSKYNRLRIIDVRGLTRLGDIDISYNNICDISDVIGYENSSNTDLYITLLSPANTWTDNPFTDISESDYYYKAVEYVAENGFMGGTSATTFSPMNTITRAQLVTVLYRMAGSPTVSGTNPFTDVSSSASYYNAVKWAYNNGNSIIMGGTSATKFSPNSTVTREMAAVVIDRYATRMGYTLDSIRDYEAFTDADDISNWAVSSIEKLYEAGIINGTLGYYYPTDTIERGDLAVIIRKFEVIRLYL